MNTKSAYRLLALLTAALAACSEPSDVYYSTRYEVTALEATVTLTEEPSEPENPGSGEETAALRPTADEEQDNDTGSALADEIRDAVLSSAPVQAGGSYTLDYTEYNGGRLHIVPAAGGEALEGTFIKMPGSSEITFRFGGDQELKYTFTYYTDAENKRLTRLSTDLTEHYRTLYPDAGIQSVVRYENTSHPYN